MAARVSSQPIHSNIQSQSWYESEKAQIYKNKETSVRTDVTAR